MTLFIDLRASSIGGIVAQDAVAWDDGNMQVTSEEFANRIEGRDLVFVAHGFNVSREDGIKSLTMWSQHCKLSDPFLFIGVLWPGDSRFLPFVDYVYEGAEAISSGKLLANYLNHNATGAASVSFASHSLGARTVLEALRWLECTARRLIVMAAAIESDCLSKEYVDAAKKAQEIYILASRSDWVLEWAFPAGNLIGEIIMRGHPYDRTALGRNGPSQPIALTQRGGSWQIPDPWDYGHLDYLPSRSSTIDFPSPVDAPGPTSNPPGDPKDPGKTEWKSSWSAGAVASQMG